ncbi:MAG: alpha/beta hydrolase [Mycobacterium sp.]
MVSHVPTEAPGGRSGTHRWVGPHPIDAALAVTDLCAALPVIGKRLEILGTMTAIGAWGSRMARPAPKRSASADTAAVLPTQRAETTTVAAAALRDIVKTDLSGVNWPAPDRLPPMLWGAQKRRQLLHKNNIRYGDAPEQLLEVWRRKDLVGPAPVLVFVPGGGWLHGGRMMQGHALMAQLAEQGWVCVAIDYRVAPRHRWPRHMLDVKAAVAWTRANVDQFGGDPRFVAVAGCSAGGHLAALAGLTSDDREFSAELPDGADTSVDAVVGIYGRYDWIDRSTRERDDFVRFLERIVVRKRVSRDPDVFRNASPIARVRPDAPPFLVVHGTGDSVIPVAQARAFVDALRATSKAPVNYLELPGAGHAFDLTDRWRTRPAVMVIAEFLREAHRRHQAQLTAEAI